MKTVVAGAIGECVHIAGVVNFLRLAEKAGWRTVFLGPATPIDKIIETAIREKAEMVGVSYRLTPETGEQLIGQFAEEAAPLHQSGVSFVFGGTPPVVERVAKIGFFEALFDGSEGTDQVLAFLKGEMAAAAAEDFPQSTIARLQWKSPFPLLRHHFGLPDLEATRNGIHKIAEACVLDVISLGVDQDAQENFFHPERQDNRQRGAGGVPVRSAEDYRSLYQASRTGNYPLMRTYSGTDDFFQLAEMYVDTIDMAWAAVPLFWFNQMDGRGPWDLEGSIRQHQQLMAWYGRRDIPVEANEAHHWGMRDAPDVIFVAAAYLAAYNARACGVKDHIVQMMFNSPPATSDAMDIAKMLAVMQMVSLLESADFRIWRQTRTGLLSYPLDEVKARAHLATSVYIQMAVEPHILHVVGYPEAHHAATPEEVIVSCIMAQEAIEKALSGKIELANGINIKQRVEELVEQTQTLIESIRRLGENKSEDPLSDAEVLSDAVTCGLLDAPQLINNPFGRGEIHTSIDGRGACLTIDPDTGKPINEAERTTLALSRRKYS